MSQPIISVQGLGKRYRLGERVSYGSLRESIMHAAGAPARWASARRRDTTAVAAQQPEDFWALRDVSFDVEQGEIVGLIGRNGAGKSTALKILSRVTAPTEGVITLRGRVGSLLEVGTGFHPELTGRENIYMNGVILGLTRAEVRRKFDEIVEFSGVEEFLDTPAKRYSSGMYVRLAFAVAAHLEPEILIVDEVLAVGDIAFQQKCLGKMSDVARGGRTVLFVSHNMNAVQNLCTRTILFERGRLVANGKTDEVIGRYLSGNTAESAPDVWIDVTALPRAGSGRARVTGFRYSTGGANGMFYPHSGGPLELEMRIHSDTRQAMIDVAFVVYDRAGMNLVNISTKALGETVVLEPGENYIRAHLRELNLNSGRYAFGWWLETAAQEVVDNGEIALSLDVADSPVLAYGVRPPENGIVLADYRFELDTPR